ncbi:MAG: tol-pal system protein YbgF [Burkholderiales bacterium]|nr:tol-pal system protein YbgF [Burkholderiales bacterium]
MFSNPFPFLRNTLLVAVMALSLNATAGLFDDEEARKDLRNLRAQIDQQNRDNDARLQKIEESIRNLGIIQLLNQIEQLNAEIAKLRGQVEVMSNLDEQLTKRQRDFYLDIDTRLRKLEGVPGETPAGAPAAANVAPAAAISVPPTVAQTAASRAKEDAVYDVGSNAFKRGDYAAAIRAFQTFIKDYPSGQLVSNAHYWMGISYFNLRDYGSARTTQDALLKQFPDSAKAPDALLAMASIYAEIGDNGSARNALEDVIAKYPGSEAAGKARTRLPALRR